MENKFRIYDTENKQYIEEPDHRWLLSRSGRIYNSKEDEWYDSNNEWFIIEFYTGLKDKNEKEIYKGDIIKCHEYDSRECFWEIIQTFENAVVGFEKGSFYYYPKGNMKQPHQFLMYAYLPEIIGNIHDNPELSKK